MISFSLLLCLHLLDVIYSSWPVLQPLLLVLVVHLTLFVPPPVLSGSLVLE